MNAFSGPPDSNGLPALDSPLISSTIRIPFYLLRALFWSVAATVIVGLPCMVGNDLYTEEQSLLILLVHFCVLIWPMAHITRALERRRDYFHPIFLAGLTFMVFQVAMNPVVYSDPIVLASRNLDVTGGALLTSTVLHSYLVLFVSWIAYLAGQTIWARRAEIRTSVERPETRLFLIVAVAFIAIGVLGNIGILGGVGTYLSKMAKPWERWTEFEEGSVEGGTKWAIFMRFLPVGLLVLVYGIYLRRRLSHRAFYILLFAASIANMVLSCASGGRGPMFLTAFYGIVLVNHSVQRLSFRALSSVFVVLLVLAFILGQLRGAAYFGTEASFLTNKALVTFGSLYLSNYLGTLTLVAQVEREGIIHGGTAFAGVKGLLGGATPVTTEAEVWYRVTGKYYTENPRYGAPGELYFNFGWIGVIIGMALVGMLVKWLTSVYERSESDISVGGGLMAVFAAFSANFVMIANLSYLAPYFTYFSAPFYAMFWLYRKRRT